MGCGYRVGSGKIVSQNKQKTSCSSVVSVYNLWVVVSERVMAKL